VHVGSDGEVVEVSVEHAGNGPRQHGGLEDDIGVGEQDELAGGACGAALQRVVLAQPPRGELGDVLHLQSRVGSGELVEDGAGAISRAIVYGDDLEVGIVETQQRPHRLADVALLVARRNDHRYPRQGGTPSGVRELHLIDVLDVLFAGYRIGGNRQPCEQRQYGDNEKGGVHASG